MDKHQSAILAFTEEIEAVVTRFTMEFEIMNASAVGVLTMVANRIMRDTAKESDQGAEEEYQNDDEEFEDDEFSEEE